MVIRHGDWSLSRGHVPARPGPTSGPSIKISKERMRESERRFSLIDQAITRLNRHRHRGGAALRGTVFLFFFRERRIEGKFLRVLPNSQKFPSLRWKRNRRLRFEDIENNMSTETTTRSTPRGSEALEKKPCRAAVSPD